jgi:hypothetical protein
MDDTVSLSFRYTAKDIERATRSHYISRTHVRLDIFVAVVVGVFGVYLQRLPSSHAFATFLVGAAEVFARILVIALVIIPRSVFRRIEAKFRDHDDSLTFSADRVRRRSTRRFSGVCTRMYWSMLTPTCSTMAHGRLQ